MKWLDVAGPPGCGKSTLCYPIWGDKSVTWDGKPPPVQWGTFLDEITALCLVVKDHPSFQAVLRMNDRSAKKMATVARMSESIVAAGQVPEVTQGKVASNGVFIQTGFVQRILGFGWRLQDMGRDINLIRRALWLMPVSVGVAFLDADLDTILSRNKARESVASTAHENRSYQVPLMLPSIELAKEVLRERGVAVSVIDVQHQSVDDARAGLLAAAAGQPGNATAFGPGSQMEIFSTPPPWWR